MKRNFKVFLTSGALVLSPMSSLWGANASLVSSVDGISSVAYDPANREIYVADGISGGIKVISGTSNAVIKTIHVSMFPSALAIDPANDNIYVANAGSDTISVINRTTNSVSTTLPAGSIPIALVIDPLNKDVYVADAGSDAVRMIDSLTGAVHGTVRVGVMPDALAFDPRTGDIYVADAASNNLKVIDGKNNLVIATLPTGKFPSSLVFGYSNRTSDAGYMDKAYESNSASNDIFVLNSTNAIVSKISTGAQSAPDAMAYDSMNKNLYVANAGLGTVSVIDTKSDTVVGMIPVGKLPDSIAYDSANKKLYVTNAGSGTISVINRTTNTVTVTLDKL